MAETALELRAILEAAERAVSIDDFVSAEQHLRQAAALQEQQIGNGHPDLANTLNNLGIVCEHVGKPAEAEACYRRAYGIASSALPAGHPLVQTSGQNLRDFCEAIGKPVELSDAVPPGLEPFAPGSGVPKPALAPVAAPVVPATAAPAPPPRPAPVARDPESPSPASPPLRLASETRVPEPPPRKPTEATRTAYPVSPLSPPSSRLARAIAMGAVLLVAFGTWWFGFRQPSRPVAPSTPRVETPAPSEEAPPPANAAPEPAPIPASPETPASAEAPTGKPPIADAPVKPVARETAAPGAVSMAEAKLCRSLTTSNWSCTPATSPAAPGVFFFYTRVKSARDTTVQHRWLLNGRLVRSVDLRIRANPGAGYRTYSRSTVSGERRSDWTIELRDAEGALLHEERFTVR
jgi:Tetratricopeptide repeat/Protein of unknown function (DUF2914)